MKYSVEKYTPEKAKWILENQNNYNRNISQAVVLDYKRQMLAKEFLQNGDSIKFAVDPKTKKEEMIDGQHRLMAIVAANTSLDILTIRDIDFNAFYTIDKGKKRDLRDDLQIDIMHKDNIKISKQLACAISGCINYLIVYERNKFWSFKNISGAYMLSVSGLTRKIKQDFFNNKKEEIILNIPLSLKYKSKIKLVPNSIKAAIFIIQKRQHPDLVSNFWEQLYSDSPEDVRIASLRTHLATIWQKTNTSRDINIDRSFSCLQSIVICWNSIVEDRRYNTFKGISKYFCNDEIVVK